MADTNIEWAERVWNPLAGCTRVSPGCQHCYAERMAKRLVAMGQKPYEGTVDKNGRWTGRVNLIPEKLDEPLKRAKPTTYFVNSMSDLFHDEVPDEYIDKVFGIMALAARHRFIVLTKRAQRMRDYMIAATSGQRKIFDGLMQMRGGVIGLAVASRGIPKWENVVLGVSVEDQARADERIPLLLETPAVTRCISAEPLLGPVDLRGKLMSWHNPDGSGSWFSAVPGKVSRRLLNWVIVGGESGPGARPMDAGWVRALRDQCVNVGVAFFFKQWGGPSKKQTGRLLDGVEWSELPAILEGVSA